MRINLLLYIEISLLEIFTQHIVISIAVDPQWPGNGKFLFPIRNPFYRPSYQRLHYVSSGVRACSELWCQWNHWTHLLIKASAVFHCVGRKLGFPSSSEYWTILLFTCINSFLTWTFAVVHLHWTPAVLSQPLFTPNCKHLQVITRWQEKKYSFKLVFLWYSHWSCVTNRSTVSVGCTKKARDDLTLYRKASHVIPCRCLTTFLTHYRI